MNVKLISPSPTGARSQTGQIAPPGPERPAENSPAQAKRSPGKVPEAIRSASEGSCEFTPTLPCILHLAAWPRRFHLPQPPDEIPPPPLRTIKPPRRTIIVVLQSEAQHPWKSPAPSLLISQHKASIYLPKKAIIN